MATAAVRYTQLARGRETILRQAREAARLTIPGLIPAQGSSDPHDIAEQPYSSLGARGVNNVSAKLLLSQFPPEKPFFRLDIDPQTASDMGTDLGPAEAALAQISHRAMVVAESSGSRTAWMEVFRHLVVAGNMLVYHPVDGTKMRLWRLDQYVIRRDAQGNLLEALVEEEVYPSELDQAVLQAVGLAEAAKDKQDKESAAMSPATKAGGAPGASKEEQKIKLYTWVQRVGGNVIHFEQINGIEVPGSRGQSKVEETGWQALRWQEVPGSDYGRSFVTEYAGDFYTLEDAMKAILQFAAEASRIIRIVDPNAGIDVEELARAQSGDFLTGFREKIETLQLDKNQDFQTLWNVTQMVERRLSQAFLLTANTIRDAERVTAEEIRAVAQELEDAFGGTYSVLSAEVQSPYARRLLFILSKQKKAPKLPSSVTPVIITGFAALGQNHEVAGIVNWLMALRNIFGPEFIAGVVNAPEVALRMGVGSGIVDVQKLVKTADEIAQAQQQQLQSQAGIAAAPQIAKGTADAINKQGAQPSASPQQQAG